MYALIIIDSSLMSDIYLEVYTDLFHVSPIYSNNDLFQMFMIFFFFFFFFFMGDLSLYADCKWTIYADSLIFKF